MVSQYFGYHMVKLGDLSSQLDMHDSPIRHHIAQATIKADNTGLMSSASQLPYQENSVDLFILAHELDFAADPHQILREVNQAITANGHVIIIGYNPFSLAGLAKYLPLKPDSLLHQARCFTPMRVKDWLSLLGFSIVEDRRLFLNELLFERRVQNSSSFQHWANHYLGWLGALYILVAKKTTIPLTPAKPLWRTKPKFNVVGASMRNGL